ncbi:MAG TPA: hypothetical protein VGE18_01900 [Candidatus Paceibacterota bacterium]
MVYLVTYDLNKLGKDYTNLYAALKRYDYIKDVGLDSVWFVSTTWTAAQIYEHLRHYIDVNDRLVITKMNKGEHQGWMHKDIWIWINSRI